MTPLLPGTTLGVLGGGQLGRMMALEARCLGYRVEVLDPNPLCPAGQVADGVVVGRLDDEIAACELGRRCQVVTLDTEHVPHPVLEALERVVPVLPGSIVLRTIQDRLEQKRFIDRLGLPQARWAPAGDAEQLRAALRELGGVAVLKARTSGYDGKGQFRIEAGVAPEVALAAIDGVPAVVEELVDFAREVSVVLARGHEGEVRIYPLAENVHRRHILHTTRAPAPMAEDRRRAAEAIATAIATALGHVGTMAVEMFERRDGSLLVNEIAPRTHNSGHYTFGACVTSQFEQHVRAVCGLPLGDPRQRVGAVMLNLIGDLWARGVPRWEAVLRRPDAHLHLYGKEVASRGRKMGHVLLLGDDTDANLGLAETLLGELAG